MYNCLVAASVEILKQVPLFAGLDKRDLQQIAGSMRERRFAEGDVLTEEGAGAAGFFIVAEGKANVTVGGELRGSVGPGDYFGEVALLTGSAALSLVTGGTAEAGVILAVVVANAYICLLYTSPSPRDCS